MSKEDETIEEDEETTEETQPVETSVPETVEDTTDSDKIPVLGPTTTIEVPLTQKPGFWVAVILLNIIVVGGIAFLIVKVVGKK